jgi:hypothetical protein
VLLVAWNSRETISSQSHVWSRPARISREGSTTALRYPTSFGLRRACGLYVWDAPSALLYRWSRWLLKDCVYEGLGGQKFVRIEPGSILQLLYPWSRYSPDRCVLCGGTFQDHLTLWWSKNLYTPFDQILDKDYKQGVQLQQNEETGYTGATKRRGANHQKESDPSRSDRPAYVYHRRYVLDDRRTLISNAPYSARRRMQLKNFIPDSPQLVDPIELKSLVVGETRVSYIVRAIDASERGNASSFILASVRAMLLRAVENLIYVEIDEKRR